MPVCPGEVLPPWGGDRYQVGFHPNIGFAGGVVTAMITASQPSVSPGDLHCARRRPSRPRFRGVCRGGDDAAWQLKEQFLDGCLGQGVVVGRAQRVSLGGASGVAASQRGHGFRGFSSGEDGVDASGCPAQLVLQDAEVPALALRTPCSMSVSVRMVNCRLLAKSVRLR